MNEEQIEKAKNARSAEELLELAKEYGMEMTEEEAADLYERLHTSGELTDEELEDVAGGCGSSASSPDTVTIAGVTHKVCSKATTPCFTGKFKKAADQRFTTLPSPVTSDDAICGNCNYCRATTGKHGTIWICCA